MKSGVVAIGRNEGERLKACIASLPDVPVVYVDSGSSDGSVEFARSQGATVVELDMAKPFSAARARNAGFAELLTQHCDLEVVMFVDGDCAVAPDWLAVATEFLAVNPHVAAVCGRRQERFANASVYNLLCDIEWDTPIGRAAACGGDAVYRVKVFEAAGGFDPTFIAGEEPELCFRIRAAGHCIERLDAPMTLHDAAMTRFKQWWKRAERSGYAYYLNAHKHGGETAERFRVKEVKSILAWAGAALFALAAAMVFVSLWPVVLFLLVCAAQYLRLVNKLSSIKERFGSAAARWYAANVLAAKIPQALGVAKAAYKTFTCRDHTLLEYK